MNPGARGHNPRHGFDQGPPPPGIPGGQPGYFANQMPYPNVMPPMPGAYPHPIPQPIPQPHFPGHHYPMPVQTQPFQMYHPGTVAILPTGEPFYFANYGPPSNINPYPGGNHPVFPYSGHKFFPGTSFENPTGGVGLPPGYDYMFPKDHVTIHCFKPGGLNAPPWETQISATDDAKFVKLQAPTCMKMSDFMEQIGCRNADPKKNVITQIVMSTGGRWSRDYTIKGDDKDRMKKTLEESGWKKECKGLPGGKQIIWIYPQNK